MAQLAVPAPASLQIESKLHRAIRHTVELCWKDMHTDLYALSVLKGIAISDDAVESYKGEIVELKAGVQEGWACWDSADHLCDILAGKTLTEIASPKPGPEVTSLKNRQKYAGEIEAMKMTDGPVLVRINIIGAGLGHAYVFVSEERTAGTGLKGYIYQTNVGCKEAFDLLAWLTDPNSRVEVELEKHLDNVQNGFLASHGGTPKAMASAYERQYMLTGTKMGPLQLKQLQDLQKNLERDPTQSDARIMWSPLLKQWPMRLLALRVAIVAPHKRVKPLTLWQLFKLHRN